jgi:DNA polymerase V
MKIFALCDCNNFYCSAERLFRPDLKHQPVLVLSNNDGCCVARSQEVKALGVKMGEPLFKVKDLIKAHNVQVFSSNYTLYADISQRVMHTLEGFSPLVEIYSIDEAFLRLDGFRDLDAYGKLIKNTVFRHVGIPVSIGVAPTKTLAKLANFAAKKYGHTEGVVDLCDPERQARLRKIVPVSEVWGVGRRLTKKLAGLGVRTAEDLALLHPKVARKTFSVVLERTVRELNGESCIDLEEVSPPKKQIICSRSFGAKITDYRQLREAVCEFVLRGAEKLRQENQRACTLSVFIRTSPFDSCPQYGNVATGTLLQASSDSHELLKLAVRLFDQIWREGYRYAKGGILLTEFRPEDQQQLSLLEEPKDVYRSDKLMRTLDTINRSGCGKVWFGAQRAKKDWFMTQARLSPAYTTDWEALPVVHF